MVLTALFMLTIGQPHHLMAVQFLSIRYSVKYFTYLGSVFSDKVITSMEGSTYYAVYDNVKNGLLRINNNIWEPISPLPAAIP